mmetsp:Transcript_59068/g.97737  ORF Transcript_59068/g.97737 Transcript_59068/m.97737 type:complete len:107 (-) Transcript_59068:505-825(-)
MRVATIMHFRNHVRSKCNWVEAVGILARARRDARAFESANTLQRSIEQDNPNAYSHCITKTSKIMQMNALPDIPAPVVSVTRSHLQRHCAMHEHTFRPSAKAAAWS